MQRLSSISNNEVVSKLAQYGLSIGGGVVVAIETSIPFVIPCLLACILDIWSAIRLQKRVKRKYPECTTVSGNFESSYWAKFFRKLIIAFAVLIMASYIDRLALPDTTDFAVRWAFLFFLFYQAYSIAENWSSENDSKMALVFQRVMVNKAGRYLDVPLEQIIKDVENEKRDNKVTDNPRD